MEQLPYRWVKIEVELPDQTLVLTKDKQRLICFTYDGEKEVKK